MTSDQSDNEPDYRDHSALHAAAGLVRLFAVLNGLGALFLGVNLLRAGATMAPASFLTGDTSLPYGTLGIFVLLLGLGYAVCIWGVADVFVMLADSDDAHRFTHYELEEIRRQIAGLGRHPTGFGRG